MVLKERLLKAFYGMSYEAQVEFVGAAEAMARRFPKPAKLALVINRL